MGVEHTVSIQQTGTFTMARFECTMVPIHNIILGKKILKPRMDPQQGALRVIDDDGGPKSSQLEEETSSPCGLAVAQLHLTLIILRQVW
eukprot:8505331-Pyramimonas_sp.AAC.1